MTENTIHDGCKTAENVKIRTAFLLAVSSQSQFSETHRNQFPITAKAPGMLLCSVCLRHTFWRCKQAQLTAGARSGSLHWDPTRRGHGGKNKHRYRHRESNGGLPARTYDGNLKATNLSFKCFRSAEVLSWIPRICDSNRRVNVTQAYAAVTERRGPQSLLFHLTKQNYRFTNTK